MLSDRSATTLDIAAPYVTRSIITDLSIYQPVSGPDSIAMNSAIELIKQYSASITTRQRTTAPYHGGGPSVTSL